jgi:hypothetical protein
MPANIEGATSTATWLPFTYTQTFVDVPDQWPSPGVGKIGYGDWSNDGAAKREAEARMEQTATTSTAKAQGTKMALVEVEVRELGNGRTEYIPRREVRVDRRNAAGTAAARISNVFGFLFVISVVAIIW